MHDFIRIVKEDRAYIDFIGNFLLYVPFTFIAFACTPGKAFLPFQIINDYF